MIHELLGKNHIPHSTTYKVLIELQVLKGDEMFEKHLMLSTHLSDRVLLDVIFGLKEGLCVVSKSVATFLS